VILVVCLNPALDITYQVPAVTWGGVNRPSAVYARPGGKGLNVARTLHALGAQVLLMGLVAIGSSHAMLTRDAVASEMTRLLGLLSGGRRR
jgi:tagatose 6-phosphate kinase